MPEYLSLDSIEWPRHGAGERNDYSIDWSGAASPDDSVTGEVYTMPEGITADSQRRNGLVSTVEISGGAAGQLYEIAVTATTQQGRILRRIMWLPVVNRRG